jgi:hypothetical protein
MDEPTWVVPQREEPASQAGRHRIVHAGRPAARPPHGRKAMRRSLLLLAIVLSLLTGVGVAIAATGDQWSGTGSVTSRGTETLVNSSPPFGTGLAYAVYTHRKVTFLVANATKPGGNYTLRAIGTMVNAKDETTPGSAVFSFTGFDYLAQVTLTSPTGTVVCKGGTLSWGGGAYNANDFGQFRFPTACLVFSGPQYFSTAWDGGGGGQPLVVSLFMVQQG